MFKPMLAGTLDAPFTLAASRFPVFASPKLDGIRATIQDGRVISRSLKPIPNDHVQDLFGRGRLEGLDGELILGDPSTPDGFRHTSGAVMRSSGKPNVVFHVFDVYASGSFNQRLKKAEAMVKAFKHPSVQIVPHNLVKDQATLEAMEAKAVELGYEGLMIRSPLGPYKCGRSTANEGYLLKMKRFLDGEGELLEMVEQCSNNNAEFTNELGRTSRSSHQENLTPNGTLGSFWVRNLETGVEHAVSPTGLAHERQRIWDNRRNLIGKVIKFKHYPTVKDKPRMPQFIGFRDPSDM